MVVAFSANELPNPTVELHVPQRPMHSVTMEHTLKPRYSDEVSATYERLPSDTQMTVRVLDHKGKYREPLLGETVMNCSHVQGDQPVYVWLPILPPAHRSYIPLKRPKTPGKPDAAPNLQVSRDAAQMQHCKLTLQHVWSDWLLPSMAWAELKNHAAKALRGHVGLGESRRGEKGGVASEGCWHLF